MTYADSILEFGQFGYKTAGRHVEVDLAIQDEQSNASSGKLFGNGSDIKSRIDGNRQLVIKICQAEITLIIYLLSFYNRDGITGRSTPGLYFKHGIDPLFDPSRQSL